jgi:type IV/VI secretion system ImpK/VasF family protein
MTLLELCEPLFLYICRLNRSARKGGSHDLSRVRGEVKALLEQARGRATAEPRLIDQFEKIELVLLFFVDFMVKESPMPGAREWKELAFEHNELAGDEKFFDVLEETLGEPSESASERLSVFYVCMGLGFTGFYTGQPEYLRKKMLQCSARLKGLKQHDEVERICPEAYENVDTRNLVEPPGKKLLGIAIALVGLIIVLFVANLYLFLWTSQDLTKAMDAIIHQGRSLVK